MQLRLLFRADMILLRKYLLMHLMMVQIPLKSGYAHTLNKSFSNLQSLMADLIGCRHVNTMKVLCTFINEGNKHKTQKL